MTGSGASSWLRRSWLNGRTAGFNAVRVQAGQWPDRGTKRRSCRAGWAAAVGSERRPSRERAATSETGQPQSFARIPSGYMLKI